MRIKLYQVDAFTDRLFGGNPAAVCPLESWLPDTVLQNIAAENNLSETAFFTAADDRDEYEIRWFTPEMEIDLCGHATLASAHIILTELAPGKDQIRFQTRMAGELVVSRQRNDGLYVLDFPARSGMKTDLPDGLLSALRSHKSPVDSFKARDHMLVFEDELDVLQMSPDFRALDKVESIVGVIVTAPGRTVDFVSRYFSPNTTVPEDPVTGSAHCTLIPYWANRLNKNQLHAHQVSARRGELWCENQGERVLIKGKAVTYLRGEIDL